MKYTFLAIDSVVQSKQFEQPDTESLKNDSFKYVDIERALSNSNDYIKNIISHMPIRNDRKYVVVDVKIHDLEKDTVPALSNWHCDCIGNPLDERRIEHHHIFVSGFDCLTQFLAEEITLDINPNDSYRKYDAAFSSVQKAHIPSATICSYERHIHRAVPSTSNFRRLLVRVSETDIIVPNRQSGFKLTYTKRKNDIQS